MPLLFCCTAVKILQLKVLSAALHKTVMSVMICLLEQSGCPVASRGKTQPGVIVLTLTSAMWLVYKTEKNNLLFGLGDATGASFLIVPREINESLPRFWFLFCLHSEGICELRIVLFILERI